MWRANFKILNLKSKFFAQNIILNQIYKLVFNNFNNFYRDLTIPRLGILQDNLFVFVTRFFSQLYSF